MKAIQVIDSAHLVSLPAGRSIMVGAPPEALKILVLWESPFPSVVVLPPDPLFAHGINQASFEFLLYNHMFRMGGLQQRRPFTVVCQPGQKRRVEELIRHQLRGPSDEEMAAFKTPAHHRRQLLLETTVVSGEVSKLRLDQMARVATFENGRLELPDGTRLTILPSGELQVEADGESISVPYAAARPEQLPLYFPDVDMPVHGPRFGLQIIGSASGFSGAEWGSCFIVWINGQPLIIDGTPYLGDHLRRLGIEDEHILGYLITHNHEDHANAIGQLVGRRSVTVLTSPPVMAGLVARLSALLDCPAKEVTHLFKWVPLHPGLNSFGDPLHWFGAEIRTWYSVHTLPTLGVDVSMDGKHVRMPGDTLWGRQLEPLLEQKVISPERHHLIQHTYDGADVIVADAGGGPIHPDPQEVSELVAHGSESQLMVTHVPEFARPILPTAEPGTVVELIPREPRTPEDAMALFGSPVLRGIGERWLLALLYGGTVVDPPEEAVPHGDGAFVVLSGTVTLLDGEETAYLLQRGDLFHPGLAPEVSEVRIHSTATWTRLLQIPEALYQAFLRDTGITKSLERLYRTRNWWRAVTAEELGLDSLVSLALMSRERGYGAGKVIISQQDPGHTFYLLTEGKVEVLREADGRRIPYGVFGPGYYFGEIALLDEAFRTATVRAMQEVRVLELPSRAFHRHLMDIPLARHRICRMATERILEQDQDLRGSG